MLAPIYGRDTEVFEGDKHITFPALVIPRGEDHSGTNSFRTSLVKYRKLRGKRDFSKIATHGATPEAIQVVLWNLWFRKSLRHSNLVPYLSSKRLDAGRLAVGFLPGRLKVGQEFREDSLGNHVKPVATSNRNNRGAPRQISAATAFRG